MGRETHEPARLYLTGGGTAVVSGWRDATVDVDIKLVPSGASLMRAIPRLKESMNVNIELASPDDFIPVLPGWEERSPFVRQYGALSCFHFDPVAQALAKIERGFARDLEDVRAMLARGIVGPAALRQTFEAIAPEFYRYPAIDPSAFGARLDQLLGEAPG